MREGRTAAFPLAGLLLFGLPSLLSDQAGPSPSRSVGSCESCHQEIAAGFKDTAHFNASRPARADTILGSFDNGLNVLKTRVKSVFFRMEQREDGFYQTGFQHGAPRSERFDLVIGSGRRGQSYLYWKDDLLFQLPVSYLAATGAWVNSPGYTDGTVHFDRLIPPRCLECHASYFGFQGSFPKARYDRDYVLGVACRRCHGEGVTHAEIRNPARLTRERRVEVCALCHSGIRESRRSLYQFRPGENLDDYLAPEQDTRQAKADVHGNQVALLRESRCFAASPEMSCATCHNVHRVERNPATLSKRCLQCHDAAQCELAPKLGTRIADGCVDCHMPVQRSKVIAIETAGSRFFQGYRTHAIGTYREATRAVLRSMAAEKN
jgi:Cytochrome c554 and c-prime